MHDFYKALGIIIGLFIAYKIFKNRPLKIPSLNSYSSDILNRANEYEDLGQQHQNNENYETSSILFDRADELRQRAKTSKPKKPFIFIESL